MDPTHTFFDADRLVGRVFTPTEAPPASLLEFLHPRDGSGHRILPDLGDEYGPNVWTLGLAFYDECAALGAPADALEWVQHQPRNSLLVVAHAAFCEHCGAPIPPDDLAEPTEPTLGAIGPCCWVSHPDPHQDAYVCRHPTTPEEPDVWSLYLFEEDTGRTFASPAEAWAYVGSLEDT